MSPRQYNIVSVGDLTVDLIMPVALPIPAASSIEVPWHNVEPGGSCNFLIAGHRVAGDNAVVHATGPLGDDIYGREVIQLLHSEGIDADGISIVPGSVSTVVLVLMEPNTGRFTYVWRGCKGDIVPPSETTRQIIDQADALFMQGYTLVEPQMPPLLDYVFASGRPIWFDVGPAITAAPEELRERTRQHAHAILSTEEELPNITGGRTEQAAYDYLLSYGIKLLVIKRGGAGCRVVTPTERFDVPAFSVPIADLVGAGDCFNATFIYASCLGLPLLQRAQLANAGGAAKVQKLGSGRSMPYRDEIQAVLHANGLTIEF
ncbi:MAG: carbohydrate kinase family protein [Anaerolineae bacterium]|nr:carbohydrate kinase family protein [Anaerolineae bacterium]